MRCAERKKHLLVFLVEEWDGGDFGVAAWGCGERGYEGLGGEEGGGEGSYGKVCVQGPWSAEARMALAPREWIFSCWGRG